MKAERVLRKYDNAVGEVVLEDGITKIGGAFRGSVGLKRVVLPASVKEIGDEAFCDCKDLKEVVLPECLEKIGKRAFKGCISLTEISIPAGVQKLESECFQHCVSLEAVHFGEGLRQIGMSAFAGCTSLKSVRFPATLEKIGWSAFQDCSMLTDVMFNEGLTEIAEDAFIGCVGLREVNIPSSVRVIGMNAFMGCYQLERLQMNVEQIRVGQGAFRGCRRLEDADGFAVLNGTLLHYSGSAEEVAVPRHITAIGDSAFYYSRNVKRVVLHDGIERIGESAFRYNGGLEEITIPDGVGFIDDRAFLDCRRLTVYVQGDPRLGTDAFDGVKLIIAPRMSFASLNSPRGRMAAFKGYMSNRGLYTELTVAAAYHKYAISQRKRLLPEIFKNDDVRLLALLAEMGRITAANFEKEYMEPALAANATDCKSFLLDWRGKSLTIAELEKQAERELMRDPYSVTEMKKVWNYEKNEDGTLTLTAYKGGETAVIVPERIGKAAVTRLGDYLFSSVKRDGFYKSAPQRKKLEAITSVEIPDTITSIGEGAFFGRVKLERVNIPDSVTEIGLRAFNGCPKLADDEGFVIVRDTLYGYYGSATELVIPQGVAVISERALFANIKVEHILLPQGTVRIGALVFSHCTKLKKVWMPATVEEIDDKAFRFAGWVTVCCKEGSYVEEYAKAHGLKFSAE